MAQKLWLKLLYLAFFIFCFSFNYANAAKIASIKGKKVVLYLETTKDEDIKKGDRIVLTSKNKKPVATLMVTRNRGLMADTAVVKGDPKKAWYVLMPHQQKSNKNLAKKKKTAAVRKVARTKIKKMSRKVAAHKVRIKKSARKSIVRKAADDSRDVADAFSPLDVEPNSNDLKIDEPAPVVEQRMQRSPASVSTEETTLKSKYESSSEAGNKDWYIATELLANAGVMNGYQAFNVQFERKLFSSFAVGLVGSYGTYEATNADPSMTDKPSVSRMEYGAEAVYNFSGDVFGTGIYTGAKFALIQEDWNSTQTFGGAKSKSSLFAGSVGYQYVYSSLSVRLGYQFQQSNMAEVAQFMNYRYNRTPTSAFGASSALQLNLGFVF